MGRAVLVLATMLLMAATCVSTHPAHQQPLVQTGGANDAPVARGPGANWPQYLFNAAHSSHNPQAVEITRANADSLVEDWRWTPDRPSEEGQPPPQLLASPTVFRGRVYIGVRSGDFYALDETTGSIVWKRSLGYVDGETCGDRGITSTAAVVAGPNGRVVVYVGGGDGLLYALNAVDGSTIWKSPVVEQPPPASDGGYIWSSPTVIQHRVYIGVSSHCGAPLIRGGVRVFDRSSGGLLATYWTVAKGRVGGSVWTSVSGPPAGGSVFTSTGNGDPDHQSSSGDAYSVVRLGQPTLVRQDAWTVPDVMGTDQDFPASPALFRATIGGTNNKMVGACNKNGTFYAFDRSALSSGPVWTAKLSTRWPKGHCLPAAVWDAKNRSLYLSGAQTRIGGKSFRGSVRSVDPATGEAIWILGLPGVVWGTPSLNGSGILAVPSFDVDAKARRGVFLIDAKQGEKLTTLDTSDSPVFAQPIFAGPYLFVATFNHGLIAFTTQD